MPGSGGLLRFVFIGGQEFKTGRIGRFHHLLYQKNCEWRSHSRSIQSNVTGQKQPQRSRARYFVRAVAFTAVDMHWEARSIEQNSIRCYQPLRRTRECFKEPQIRPRYSSLDEKTQKFFELSPVDLSQVIERHTHRASYPVEELYKLIIRATSHITLKRQ